MYTHRRMHTMITPLSNHQPLRHVRPPILGAYRPYLLLLPLPLRRKLVAAHLGGTRRAG